MELKNLTTTKHKLTAAQVEVDCPARLKQIGQEIAARLAKADKQTELAQNHLIAIDELLAEAKELCDGGAFKRFRELFCPQLGKSQAYALLAIAAGKKTLAEHRTGERERKQRTRANQKAAAANSGTVPEKPEPAPEPSGRQEAPPEIAPADAPSIVPEQTPEAAKPRRAVTPKDEALFDFTARVCDLIRRTRGQKLDHFAKTAVSVDDLAKLGKFLTDLANLKKRSAARGNDTVSTERSAEDMKAKHAAREAGGDQAA